MPDEDKVTLSITVNRSILLALATDLGYALDDPDLSWVYDEATADQLRDAYLQLKNECFNKRNQPAQE